MVNKLKKRGYKEYLAIFQVLNLIISLIAFSILFSIDIVNAESADSSPLPTATKVGSGFESKTIILDKNYQFTLKGGNEVVINSLKRTGENTWALMSDGKGVGTTTTEFLQANGLTPKYFVGGHNFDSSSVLINAQITPTGLKDPVVGRLLKDKNVFLSNEGKLYEKVDKKWVEAGKTSELPSKIGTQAILENAMAIGFMFGLGYMIGGAIGGTADVALGTAMAVTSFVRQATGGKWGRTLQKIVQPVAKKLGLGLGPGVGGVVIGAIIFAVMYKKESKEIVEFNCQPYQPPIGGKDCELCNKFGECSEYRCKSLGQACELLNAGTEDEKCTWVNPRDVTSPKIKISELLSGYKWVPDTVVRPPATGVVISQTDGTCVEAFTPLEFTLTTDEPAQCKVDYNLTRGFEEMSYYIGGSNLFSYNHTEEMSLPGPDAINAVAPELQNDGTYTLYVRCQDANGNFNQDAFSVRFCVEPGPDTTPPRIDAVSIPSNSPINYNESSLDLEVYVNEPANCKWSREDRTFDNMENSMSCATNVWEMNNKNVYTCLVTLTGIENRKINSYYFRCKDQPVGVEEGDRNVNTQSYLYNIAGTQPLNIMEVEPNGTIYGSTDTIPVYLTVETDNGYKDGEAICYYSTSGEEEDYIEFLETGGNEHSQRQDLITGDYLYYYKCVDLGGNAAYNSSQFRVETDRAGPVVVRIYKESGELKIITNEDSTCSYSNTNCNFNIEDGIQMPYSDDTIHTAEWKISQNYYIRCKDEYDNQPNPNTCSIVVRPYQVREEVVEL